MNSKMRYLFGVCSLLGSLELLYAGQTSERTVDAHNDIEQRTDAVLISGISVADKPTECGLFVKPPVVIQPVTPFQAGGDWLQQMTISLVNRTNRTIEFAGIIFHFLDTGDCHSTPCAEAEIHAGQRPAIDAYDGRTGQPLNPEREHPERPPLDWKSEQTLVLHVADFMPEIEANVVSAGMPVTAVTKLRVDRGVFYFADGMAWSLGRFSMPDRQNPGKFKMLPRDYFPGMLGHNWPPGYNQ